MTRAAAHAPGNIRSQIHNQREQGKVLLFSAGNEKEVGGVPMQRNTQQHRTQRRLWNDLGKLHHWKGVMRMKPGAATLHQLACICG
jgi:hypothetical protein